MAVQDSFAFTSAAHLLKFIFMTYVSYLGRRIVLILLITT